MSRIKKGMKVKPVSPGGLCLSDVPCNGEYNQNLCGTVVFRGRGTVLEVQDIVIDYDSWPDWGGESIGKVEYRNCLVQCDNGIGWAGEGAVVESTKGSDKHGSRSKRDQLSPR